MNVIDFPTGTITHLTLQSKATDLYSRARQLSPAPAILVLESASEASQRPRLSPTYSASKKVRNCGLGPHADQTDEMVRIWAAFCTL